MTSSDQHNNQVSQALARLRIRRLPSAVLSAYAETLLDGSETPDREDLVRLLSLDPLMVVWIMKRANSSYYGLRSTVDSISRAIDVLDETSVAGMFIETDGIQDPTAPSLPGEVPDELTRHSVATAVLASVLDTGNPDSRGIAFTAGLLHDVGKHVFALNYAEEARKIYSASSLWDSLQGADLITVEQLAFGLDHVEVGEYVTRKMHFPESLTDAVKNHASPTALSVGDPSYRLSWLLHMSSLAATGLGYAAGESVSWEKCVSDNRWTRLVEEELTPWPTAEAIHSACMNSVSVIDEFLTFEADRSNSLMKTESRTKRVNRAPMRGERPIDIKNGNRDKHVDL